MNARRAATVDRPHRPGVIRQSDIDHDPGTGRHLVLLQRGKEPVMYRRQSRLSLPRRERRRDVASGFVVLGLVGGALVVLILGLVL